MVKDSTRLVQLIRSSYCVEEFADPGATTNTNPCQRLVIPAYSISRGLAVAAAHGVIRFLLSCGKGATADVYDV